MYFLTLTLAKTKLVWKWRFAFSRTDTNSVHRRQYTERHGRQNKTFSQSDTNLSAQTTQRAVVLRFHEVTQTLHSKYVTMCHFVKMQTGIFVQFSFSQTNVTFWFFFQRLINKQLKTSERPKQHISIIQKFYRDHKVKKIQKYKCLMKTCVFQKETKPETPFSSNVNFVKWASLCHFARPLMNCSLNILVWMYNI